MQTYFNVAQIILSVAIILAVLMQVKSGGLGGIFGQPDTVYRTKRGMEKTLFQFTIFMMATFVVLSIVALRVA